MLPMPDRNRQDYYLSKQHHFFSVIVEAKKHITEVLRCKLGMRPLNTAKGTRASRFIKANTALPNRQQGPGHSPLPLHPALYPQQLPPHHWLGKTCCHQAHTVNFRQGWGVGGWGEHKNGIPGSENLNP